MGAYNSVIPFTDKTEFAYTDMGRYAWLYVVAPIAAALVAGICAKVHLNFDSQELESHTNNDKRKVFMEN